MLSARSEARNKIIDDLRKGDPPAIHPDLFRAYADNLRKAVSGVLESPQYGDKYFDIQQRLQANIERFAAYKARQATANIIYQKNTVNGKERSEKEYRQAAKVVMNIYNRYQVAEYNTAISRTRTAKQFSDFTSDPENNELYPNLEWIPSRSADPREEHMPFYGLVLPKNHPFWQTNQPGNLWNCKCDWTESDKKPSDRQLPEVLPARGLEGNPATTGEIFTDNASYIASAGHNKKQQEQAEKQCERTFASYVNKSTEVKELLTKTTECTVNGEKVEVNFITNGLKEYTQSMFGNKDYFWLKNEILKDMDAYIKNAEYIGRKVSDTTHNSRSETLRLKRRTDYFYYFKITLPNGLNAVLHLGRYRDSGKMYLYTITKGIPQNTEMP